MKDADNSLRIPSANQEYVHEYRSGPGGVIQHRWIQPDGAEHTDGSSIWTTARLDQIADVACHGRPHEVKWFLERGITCDEVGPKAYNARIQRYNKGKAKKKGKSK